MGLYSKKIKDIKELKDGAEIAIPNDPTNGGRALKVLESAGLIKLKDGELLTKLDITENKKGGKPTGFPPFQLKCSVILQDELPLPGRPQRMNRNRCIHPDRFYRFHLLILLPPGIHLCRFRKQCSLH